ncbi:GNAT family N-acetyltransferase [Kitasatospora camelliae]|uniref:GNAT family N-acetyltransferase n=1 Tax=Kitasatospora camelliae TaxID=3156397 RepID=A0AAU8K6K4_9ACTN
MAITLTTDRLLIREWTVDDAEDALAIYGSADVAHWLTPVMERVTDAAAMRSVLHAWQESQPNLPVPRGRWAVQRRDDGTVVGGLGIRLLPPYQDDLEINWQLAPGAWGQGYATEAGLALIRWAFTQDVEELFAVARPKNVRAIAMAKRLGMQWVGETTKYYDLNLQVYRIRPSDLPEER